GIVAALSNFLYQNGADIMESSQYSNDDSSRMFYIRFEFYVEHLLDKKDELEMRFEPLAKEFEIDYAFTYNQCKKRSAIFVSQEAHCLLELLWEWHTGELETETPLVISNYENAREIVEPLGIPYYYIPATKAIRKEAEANQIALLE